MEPDMKNNVNHSLMPTGNTALSAHSRACPRCQSAVFNVSRRLTDLLLSVFVPLRRYRCISMKCSWEGTLREKKNRLVEPVRAVPGPERARVAAPVRIRPVGMMQKIRG
jgi:hypothetical protein